MGIVAERAFTCRTTLQRIEEGDPGIGICAAVLRALGLLEGLGQVSDIGRDNIGQAFAAAELPRWVRLRRTCARVPMPDVEVHIDLDGEPRRVGPLRRTCVERKQSPSNMVMAG